MTNANAKSSPEIVCLSCNVNENEINVIDGGRKNFTLFDIEKDSKKHIFETKNGNKSRFEVNENGDKTKKWSSKDFITVSKRIVDSKSQNRENDVKVTKNPKSEQDIA